MKVLLLNGSTRKNGCTYLALSEVAKALETDGVETEIVQMGGGPVRDCIGCNGCAGKGQCVFGDDMVNEMIAKAKEADGFVFGSPVYYAHPSGQILSLLDRVFYAGVEAFLHKPAAVVVTARRAGTTASLDVLNKYLLNAEMPVVSSTYWNMVFGPAPELVVQDTEGLQTMRNLGRNMAWLLGCIEAGRETGLEPPAAEMVHWTNFNR
ncbi:flavodoxin family protein [bacterium 1xD42-67]|nr:flavodoxin family protein [bacterium 1xD42-67]